MTVTFGDAAQQEVWHTLRSLNDTWTRGNPADLDKYFHPRMVAITASDRLRLEGKEGGKWWAVADQFSTFPGG